jgi:hypothetical protein
VLINSPPIDHSTCRFRTFGAEKAGFAALIQLLSLFGGNVTPRLICLKMHLSCLVISRDSEVDKTIAEANRAVNSEIEALRLLCPCWPIRRTPPLKTFAANVQAVKLWSGSESPLIPVNVRFAPPSASTPA